MLLLVLASAGLAAADNCTCSYATTDMACSPSVAGCELGIQVRAFLRLSVAVAACLPEACHCLLHPYVTCLT